MSPTEDNPWIPRSRAGALALFAVIALLAAIPAAIVSYSIVVQRAGDIQDAQVASCERLVADRVDNARALTELERYMDLVEDEASTDAIRNQAGESEVIIGESANQLRSRLFVCDPLIREDTRIIDDARLRETRGEL